MSEIIRIHSDQLQLQPLSIPAGFEVVINNFFSIIDQGKPIVFEDDPEDDPYELYINALLLLKHPVRKILIDLEWAPEHDPEGEFYITVIHTDDKHWEHPLYEFSSRNKDEIVDKLNELMADVAAGKIK